MKIRVKGYIRPDGSSPYEIWQSRRAGGGESHDREAAHETRQHVQCEVVCGYRRIRHRLGSGVIGSIWRKTVIRWSCCSAVGPSGGSKLI